MSDVSTLTERDLRLISVGRWPIDCYPARPLNETEVARLVRGHIAMGIKTPDLDRYRPMVERGIVCYHRRDA